MVKFDRKSLIKSQNDRLNKIYSDVNFFVWLVWVMATIVAFVVMYFFSIIGGLWLEAVIVFGCAIYYLIMSFVRERMWLGYYQNAKEIQIGIVANGIAIKEVNRESANDFLVAYDQIYKIVEHTKYFVIFLKNEGRITLPNIEQSEEIKSSLKEELKNRYLIYKD